MARRVTRARVPVRAPKRTTMWLGSGVGLTVIAASSSAVISTLSGGALLQRPFTILRTRMELWFSSDQSAASEDPQGDFGMMVVTDTAAALGITAVPNPSSVDGDPEADWFVHQPVASAFLKMDATGIQESILSRFTVDSKAMRKVGPDDDIVGVFSETGGHGAVLYTRGRMLVQLH